jgi:hypothetical protein
MLATTMAAVASAANAGSNEPASLDHAIVSVSPAGPGRGRSGRARRAGRLLEVRASGSQEAHGHEDERHQGEVVPAAESEAGPAQRHAPLTA